MNKRFLNIIPVCDPPQGLEDRGLSRNYRRVRDICTSRMMGDMRRSKVASTTVVSAVTTVLIEFEPVSSAVAGFHMTLLRSR